MAQTSSKWTLNCMYGPGVEKIAQDLSNTKEPIYKELPPYAIDEKTGEFLNKSSFPKLVKVGEVDVQERIDSYANDVDIYHILERYQLSGRDPSILMRSVGTFGDYVDIPDNLHDFDIYVGSQIDAIRKYDPELAKVIMSESSSDIDIKAAIDKYVLSRVNAPKDATLDDVLNAVKSLSDSSNKEGAK